MPPPAATFFFFNDTATTEIYTLSLHDALPIFRAGTRARPHAAPRGAHARRGAPADGAGVPQGEPRRHGHGGEGVRRGARDRRAGEPLRPSTRRRVARAARAGRRLYGRRGGGGRSDRGWRGRLERPAGIPGGGRTRRRGGLPRGRGAEAAVVRRRSGGDRRGGRGRRVARTARASPDGAGGGGGGRRRPGGGAGRERARGSGPRSQGVRAVGPVGAG